MIIIIKQVDNNNYINNNTDLPSCSSLAAGQRVVVPSLADAIAGAASDCSNPAVVPSLAASIAGVASDC
jgi:hypothetical protein